MTLSEVRLNKLIDELPVD